MKIFQSVIAAIMGVTILSQLLYGQAAPAPPANGGAMPAFGAAPAPVPDLNKKIEVNPIAAASKKQVLVYIANEPNAVAGRRVAAWLSQDAEKKQLTDWLKQDIEKFPVLVEREINEIKRHTPVENGVAIFTNKLLREGVFLSKTAGDGRVNRVAFNSDSQLEILSQPLTDAEVIRALAKNLATAFPTKDHQFLVISKSHGTDKYVMATVMGQLFNAKTKKEAFEIIEKNGAKAKSVAAAQKKEGILGDSFTGDTLGNDFTADTLGNGVTGDTLGNDFTADTLGNGFTGDTLGGKLLTTGLTKEGFFQSLQTDDSLGQLEIPLLFLESCRSQLDAAQVQELKGKQAGALIGSLYTSDKTGLRFTTINYPQLFQQTQQHGSLTEGFVKYLDGVQATQIPIPAK